MDGLLSVIVNWNLLAIGSLGESKVVNVAVIFDSENVIVSPSTRFMEFLGMYEI